jgi:hypothetical protein
LSTPKDVKTCHVFSDTDQAENRRSRGRSPRSRYPRSVRRAAVDQQQLPFERRKPRGPLSQHGIEHRPDAELFGAVSLQRQLRDAAFDDLNAKLAALDVLRRNDRPAEVESRRRDRRR